MKYLMSKGSCIYSIYVYTHACTYRDCGCQNLILLMSSISYKFQNTSPGIKEKFSSFHIDLKEMQGKKCQLFVSLACSLVDKTFRWLPEVGNGRSIVTRSFNIAVSNTVDNTTRRYMHQNSVFFSFFSFFITIAIYGMKNHTATHYQ